MTVTAFQQANKLLREGKLEEAVVAYRLAIEQNPQFYGVYENLGETLGKLGRLDEAVEMYRKAIELKPSAAWLHKELGLLLEKFGKKKEVITVYQKISDIKFNIGKQKVISNEFLQSDQKTIARVNHDSIPNLKKASELNPNNSHAYVNLGEAYQEQNFLDKAIASYRNALKIHPNFLEVRQKLDCLLIKNNKIQEGIAYYQETVNFNFEYAQGHYRLYQFLTQQGKTTEGQKHYQEFLRLQSHEVEKHIEHHWQSLLKEKTIQSSSISAPTVQRVILVFTVLDLLKAITILRQQNISEPDINTEDILVISGGLKHLSSDDAKRNAELILQVAQIWNFSKVYGLHSTEVLYNRQLLDFNATVDWIREKLNLGQDSTIYLQSNHEWIYQVILLAYPDARKIVFGDGLGELKLISNVNQSNLLYSPEGIKVDEAYLLAPLEGNPGAFDLCEVKLIDPEEFKQVLTDSAESIKGFKDYCLIINQQAESFGQSVTFVPTSYFLEAGIVDTLEREIDLYLSHIQKYCDSQETIVIKGHPREHSQQSLILKQRLENLGWNIIELKEFRLIPIEIFAVYVEFKRAITFCSASCLLLAYLWKTEVVIGLDHLNLEQKTENYTAYWKQKIFFLTLAYSLQVMQSYHGKFYPIQWFKLNFEKDISDTKQSANELGLKLPIKINPKELSHTYINLGNYLERQGNLREALTCYENYLNIQNNHYEYKINEEVRIHQSQLEEQEYDSIVSATTDRYKRLIFVVASVPHKILTVLSVLRSQQASGEYQNCDDYLILAGGNPQGVNILLQIAKIWRFKKIINIGKFYNFLRSEDSLNILSIATVQELIRCHIGLKAVDVVYHWSATDDIIWSLYPNSRKICFGDALGILKKHSISRRFNPSDTVAISEAYLIAPYEETKEIFSHCSINLIEPQYYKSVVKDSAKTICGFVEYCEHIKEKASSSIVFLPTSYFAQSPEVQDFEKEMEIYLSYALKYTTPKDTVLIKAHPSLKAQKQSRVLVQKLKENGRQCVEVEDKFDDVPLELFAILINPTRLLSVLSTCSISIGYLCQCEIVMGLDEDIIAKFKPNTMNNAQWDIKQRVIYLQTQQAYRQSFSPIQHADVEYNNKFPKFPVLITAKKLEGLKNNSDKNPRYIFSKLQHSAWLHNQLGQHYLSLNNEQSAVSEFDKATQLAPNFSGFYYDLGKALAISGKGEESITNYYRATELNFYSSLRQSILQRKWNGESNLRGLVIINSMEQPPLGMNKSIQIVAPYLVQNHGIYLEYSSSHLESLSKTIAHKLHWYDFVIFNSAASLRSWNHPNFVKLIAKLNIPVFIYWHETDWTLNQWKRNYTIAHQSIIDISTNPNFAHLTVSDACSEAIKKSYPNSKNIYKIHECTDIPKNYNLGLQKNLSISDLFVLNIASVQERKGTDLFVDTAIKVCQEHSTVKFIWLGKVIPMGKELYEKCQFKIKSLGLEKRILFPGHIESPWEYYLRNASVFFLSSRDDPFPLSILEAMCTGRNIVAFNVGGTPEALGGYGTIIEPFNIDAAAKKIINLLKIESGNLFDDNLIKRYNNLYTPEMLAFRLANCVKYIQHFSGK
ncbi:tetratricopeptide repeat protein [Microcoleus sp. B9-D4]|uniref:tetratricopeptide repeat protein n=1 Tax=Microcoleus sp. B9-D4 TaxID=2818711 RepID=UPI002FCFBF3C